MWERSYVRIVWEYVSALWTRVCLIVAESQHQHEADLWSFLCYALPPPDNTPSVCLCDSLSHTHTHILSRWNFQITRISLDRQESPQGESGWWRMQHDGFRHDKRRKLREKIDRNSSKTSSRSVWYMNGGRGTMQIKQTDDGNAQKQLWVALVFSQTFEKGGMEDAEGGGKKWRVNGKV